MKKLRHNAFWNAPNTITVIRMVFVPIVMALLAQGTPGYCALAMVLFVVAAISDLVDGYLARKHHLESIIGAFLDPLADKLLVNGVMIMLIPLGRMPAWMVSLFVLRDVTITALRGIAASEGMIIAASRWGKYKTTYENVGLSFLIFHYPLLGTRIHEIGLMLMYVGLVLALGSGLHYLLQFFRVANEADRKEEGEPGRSS